MDGLDKFDFVVVVNFFAKGGEVEVDGVGEGFFVVPDAFEDGFSGEDLALVSGEGFEEGEFSFGEFEVLSGAGGGVGASVDDEVGDLDAVGFKGGVASGEGADAGEEFGDGEGFDEVIVGADIEAGDFVFGGVAGGEHEDGGVETGAADGLGEFDAVHFGEHEVEDEESEGLGEGDLEAGFSVVGDFGVVAVFSEDPFEFGGDDEVVFDDEDAHGVIVGDGCEVFVRGVVVVGSSGILLGGGRAPLVARCATSGLALG